MTIFTIGHSNQSLEQFLAALTAHRIGAVIDIRRFPASRRHPHFTGSRLAASLRARDIDYVHLPELGGHRKPRRDSPNTAWREDAFRGYADYMETASFGEGIARLLDEAGRSIVAMMCAELLWSNCHRGLVADHLKAIGHEVIHIVSAERTEAHPYTRAARLLGGRLTYQGLL